MESFKDLKSFSKVKDASDELQFTRLLGHIYRRHKNVVPVMAMGVAGGPAPRGCCSSAAAVLLLLLLQMVWRAQWRVVKLVCVASLLLALPCSHSGGPLPPTCPLRPLQS